MGSQWSAVVCVGVALLLAIVCHPRLFFGDGVAMSIVNLDSLFFFGQWAAVALAVASLALHVNGPRRMAPGTATMVVPAVAFALLVYLVGTGIPHSANRGAWRNGELGLRAFIRAVNRQRAASTPPKELSAASFAGRWRAPDRTTYTFAGDRITWSGPTGSGEYSPSPCGAQFQIEFVERGRDMLQDLGLTWSVHAGERFDATPADARIPVAQVSCGSFDRIVFIRAGNDEVWRWTNGLQVDAIKDESFVLRRVD